MENPTPTSTPEPQTAQNKPIGLIAVAIIGLIAVVAVVTKMAPKKMAETSVAETPTTAVVANPKFKDGEYSVVGEYTSPGGKESINVTLTLKDGVVTASEVKSNATLPISMKMQGDFIEHYQPMVVGKNIADLKLDKVSGSSLTPKGFNDALEKIKTQAKV
jgi:uncharacterized protein with FMN-binding domain